MNDETIFKDEYRIRSYNTGPDGKATVSALLMILEDIAGAHAIHRGAGIQDLVADGVTWVLSRMEVKFHRRPQFGELLKGETWPTEARGLKAGRDMHFTDAEGRPVMDASTLWLIIDLKNRRPVRVTDYMHLFTLRDVRILGREPGKLTFDPAPTQAEEVKVPYSALDQNSHVNNVYYITRAMNEVPDELRENREIAGISMNYLSECFLNDNLKVGSRVEENTLCQSVYREETEVCRLRSEWL